MKGSIYIGKPLLNWTRLSPKHLGPFSQDLYALISHHSSHLQELVVCLRCSASLWLLPPLPNPAQKNSAFECQLQFPLLNIKLTQLKRYWDFFGLYTQHHLPNLWHRQVFIAVFAHSKSMWKERILRMTKHQSGCTWAVLRSIMLILEDGRSVYVMLMATGLSSHLVSSLPQLIEIEMRNLSYADKDLLISLCLITVKRSQEYLWLSFLPGCTLLSLRELHFCNSREKRLFFFLYPYGLA